MNKTGKHCTVCQENFGDKYSFCPVCGTPLHSVETNNIEQFTNTPPTSRLENIAAPAASVSMNKGNFVNHETTNNEQNQTSNFSTKEQAFGAKAVNNSQRQAQPKTTPEVDNFVIAKDDFVNHNPTMKNDGLFHITMLEEPSKAQKNIFRAGALAGLFLLLSTVLGVYLYDLYRFDIEVAEVDTGVMISPVFLSDEEPVKEEKPVVPKNTDDGGGGGGGGRDDLKPVSFGRVVPQRRDEPEITPNKDIVRRDKPEFIQRASTVGDDKRVDPRDIPPGDPNSKSTDPSDGFGKLKLGQGLGDGTGQGNGRGRGRGNGDGDGIGNGRGRGNGDGTGDGDNGVPPPMVRPTPRPTPKVEVAAVTEPLQIRSKPRPNYTESARKNSVQGTVRLRVTFSASGQVTGITPVSGLPDGLTEQAIAAARQIQFSPQKKNGVPVSVTKTIEYGFNMY